MNLDGLADADVFPDGELVLHEILLDDGDPFVEAVPCIAGGVFSVIEHLAFLRLVDACHDLGEGGLSGAIRPDSVNIALKIFKKSAAALFFN